MYKIHIQMTDGDR